MNQKLILLFLWLLIFPWLIAPAQSKPPSDNTNAGVENDLATARILWEKGEKDKAVQMLQSLRRQNESNVKLNFQLGKYLYSLGDYQKAIENLNGIPDKFPNNSTEQMQSVQMLGLSHYILGHLVETIPYLEKLAQWQPENGEVFYALGISYIQTRQPAKSREVFAKLFKVTTNSAAAYLLNAQMHVRQQFEETAEAELNKALELDPKLAQVRFVLGELAIYHAEIDKGIELLKQEIALNPSNAMAYYRLGEGLSRQLKWDEAIPPLQKSIWLNPFFSGPYIVLGKVYLKKQDFVNAESMLRRSATIDPNNFGAHYLLAQVLQQTGKTEEAKTEFALAEKLRGNNEKAP